jgi:regulator of replication initiation timing
MDKEGKNTLLKYYYDLGMTQKDILYSMASNHAVIISERHLRRILKELNLCRRSNYTDLAEVVLFIKNTLSHSGQLHGYKWMFHNCESFGLKVRKEDVRLILACLDPEGSAFRKSRRLHRREYFALGPNFIWHYDGYDKLKPFGLCVSGCVNGFPRRIIWLNVYHTNNDPKIIGGYYIEAVKELNAAPMLMRGDPGTENAYVKQFQTFLLRDGRNGRCQS